MDSQLTSVMLFTILCFTLLVVAPSVCAFIELAQKRKRLRIELSPEAIAKITENLLQVIQQYPSLAEIWLRDRPNSSIFGIGECPRTNLDSFDPRRPCYELQLTPEQVKEVTALVYAFGKCKGVWGWGCVHSLSIERLPELRQCV